MPSSSARNNERPPPASTLPPNPESTPGMFLSCVGGSPGNLLSQIVSSCDGGQQARDFWPDVEGLYMGGGLPMQLSLHYMPRPVLLLLRVQMQTQA